MIAKIRRHLESAVLCMILSCFLFAIMGSAVKFALREVPVYQAVFFRSSFAALILAIFIFFKKDSFLGNRPWLLTGRGLAGFIALSLNFYAISKISLGDAAILNQTSPLFVALFSVIFLGEKISRRVLFLSLFSFIGVAFIIKPSFSHFHYAALAGLLGGMIAALAYIAISQLHETDSSFTMAFYFTTISTLLSAPLMIYQSVSPSPFVWICLIVTGITGTFAQLLLTHAYKNEEASRVAPFSYVSVIFSFLFGMWLFNEKPDLYSLSGSGMVILACILLMKKRSKKPLLPEKIAVFE